MTAFAALVELLDLVEAFDFAESGLRINLLLYELESRGDATPSPSRGVRRGVLLRLPPLKESS